MAYQQMTRERYNALVSAFVQIGKPVYLQVAKLVGMDRETVKKAWEVGFPRAGDWAEPIRNKFPQGFAEEVKPTQEDKGTDAILARRAELEAQYAHKPETTPAQSVYDSRAEELKSSTSDSGARPASVGALAPNPPPHNAPSQDNDPDGLTDKQRTILAKEDDNLLASVHVMAGLHWMTQKALTAMKDKIGPILDNIGKIGDDKDPYAAKHTIEMLVQLTNASTRNAETMLKVMEATRLKIGQPQSISETRTPEAAPSVADTARIQASLAHMAEIAANVHRGRLVRDTHYTEPVDVDVVSPTQEGVTG